MSLVISNSLEKKNEKLISMLSCNTTSKDRVCFGIFDKKCGIEFPNQ